MELYQEKILKASFLIIWLLTFAHMTAEIYFLYWRLQWFDIVTHFLGGLWLGVTSLWFWYLSGYIGKIRFPDKNALFIALGAGLAVGLLWEVYEYGVWQFTGKGLPYNYIPDTILDLIMDVVGAGVGYLLFMKLIKGAESSETKHG